MQVLKFTLSLVFMLLVLSSSAQNTRDSLLQQEVEDPEINIQEELEAIEDENPEMVPIDTIPKEMKPTEIKDSPKGTEDEALSKTKKPGFFKRFLTKNYPSPQKAAILSLILPGSGQAYNKKYWKMPIVYGSIGALIFAIDWNGSRYRRFRDAYAAEVNGESHEFSDFEISADGLKAIRNSYDKNLQLSYVGMFLVYALNSVDAYVDAHLMRFDVSEDLSLQINPTILSNPAQETNFGIGLSLKPSTKKKHKPVNFLYGF